MYFCEKCKLTVIVTKEGTIMKACKCEAPIIANMTAVVYNHSKLRN